MAEDALFGFKFRDSKDLAEDAAVLEISEHLFSEIAMDHLGGKEEPAERMMREVEPEDMFDSFDYTEGFDFAL